MPAGPAVVVGVAQLVERQTVDLDVAGSNPVTHPIPRLLSVTKPASNAEGKPQPYGLGSPSATAGAFLRVLCRW